MKLLKLSSYLQLLNKYLEGGEVKKPLFTVFGLGADGPILTTNNDYLDAGISFIPFAGAAMDWDNWRVNPTFANFGWATLSTLSDCLGGSLIKGALKTAKAAERGIKATERAAKATKKLERTTEVVNKNPTKGTRKIRKRAFDEYNNALRELNQATRLRTVRGWDRGRHTNREIPYDWSNIFNAKTVYGSDAVLNGIQEGIDFYTH